jgi:hypothetical protein
MRIFLFASFLLAIVSPAVAQPAVREVFENQIVAIVGDKVITDQDVKGDTRWQSGTSRLGDLAEHLRRLQRDHDAAVQAGKTAEAETVRAQIERLEKDANAALNFRFSLAVNELIDRNLVIQSVKSNERFAEPPGLTDRLLADHLREQKLTHAQLARKLHQEGSSIARLRQELFDKWLVDAALYKAVTVSPRKVKEYYDAHPEVYKLGEAVDLYQITMPKAGTPQERAEAMAREIKTLADFKAKAREFRAERDGSLGWVTRKEAPVAKEILEAAFNAKPGGAKLVSGAGDHHFLIFVNERRENYQRSFAEATPEIERILVGQQMHDHYDRKIGQMKKQFFVIRFDSGSR